MSRRPEVRKVRLVCDYGCQIPLWGGSTASEAAAAEKWLNEAIRSGEIRVGGATAEQRACWDAAERDRWPISVELLYRLMAWAERWDRLASDSLGIWPGPTPAEVGDDWVTWDLDGQELAEELRRELGPGWEVEYEPMSG